MKATGKQFIVQLKISQAWKRTAVFMKLVRHKISNGHLHGPYDSYIYAIVARYREEESRLNNEVFYDRRGGDRKLNYVKPDYGRRILFDMYKYDEALREIIKNIDLQYTDKK